MAKLDPTEISPALRKMLRGRVLFRVTPWGLIASKWPRKRPEKRSPYRTYHEIEFGRAAQFSTSPVSEQVISAQLQTKGSGNVPRDLLTAASMGTAMQITLADGTKLLPARMVNPNPQYILDLITEIPGSWLVRTTEGWMGSPAPSGLPLTTTVARTSNQATSATSPYVCSWQSALIDDLGAWSNLNPTRLLVPATAQRIRWSFAIRMTEPTDAHGNALQLRDDAGAFNPRGAPLLTNSITTSGFLTKTYTAQGPWVTNPGIAWVELLFATTPAKTVALLIDSTFSIEVMF